MDHPASAVAARRAAAPRREAVWQAATLLWSGYADPARQAVLLRGEEHAPLRIEDVRAGTALGVAVEGVLRVARLAEAEGVRFQEHPDPLVRRAAATLAARAHPVRVGLGD